MKRLLCVAATAALLSACATPEPPPVYEPPPPPPPPPALSQVGMDCFVRAAESDLFEIESGRLATTMSAYPEVQNFGQMLVDDHTQSTNVMMTTVTNAGIAPPPAPQLGVAKAQQLDQLRNAGTNFDPLFLQAQIMAHEEALALHQSCANSAGAPTAGVHAQIVPVIQGHLDRARALSDAVRAQMGERG